jgi:hypothetical protein
MKTFNLFPRTPRDLTCNSQMRFFPNKRAFILLGLIPTIGGIIILIIELRSSHPYKNQWGDVPNLVESFNFRTTNNEGATNVAPSLLKTA